MAGKEPFTTDLAEAIEARKLLESLDIAGMNAFLAMFDTDSDSLYPKLGDSYYLGSASKRFKGVYAPIGRSATYVIAASDAPAHVKAQADLLCPASGWETGVQALITAAAGGRVAFFGTFTKSTTAGFLIPSNTTIDFEAATFAFADSINASAVMFENAGKWSGNTGIRIIGGTIDLNATGNTGRQVGVVFHNVTDSVIDVTWLDYDGTPYQLYGCYNIKATPSFDAPSMKFVNLFDAEVVKATKSGSNPMTATGRTFGGVWKEDSSHYHMFTGTGGIYHYTSSDGITWTEDVAHNPVLALGGAGAWDGTDIYCPMVWKEGATYYMLYGGYSADGICKVGLATSADMLTWSKSASNPVFQGTDTSWGPGAEPWGIIKVGSEYQLWYNNYGGIGGGHGRMSGRATSTDLVTWTPDLNNPIYINNRFCPWIFSFGGAYFMLVTKFDASSNYSYFELYKDTNPTFYATERVYLGNLLYTTRDASAWDGGDIDVPCIAFSNINQSLGTSSVTTAKLYHSGQTQAGAWKMGLATFSSDILGSLILLPDYYTSANAQPATLPIVSTDKSRVGFSSLKITNNNTSDSVVFPVNSAKGARSFWYLQTSIAAATTLWAYLKSTANAELGYWQSYSKGRIQYLDNSVVKGTGYVLSPDTWYLVTLDWDCNIGEYGIVVKNTKLQTVWHVEHLKLSSRSIVQSLALYRTASASALIYIGGLYTDMGNVVEMPENKTRTASGSLVPTGTCTATTVTGTFTESPAALKPGVNTLHCTASGTLSVVMPAGSSAVVTSGDATVTDSPKACPAGATTVVTVATGAGADDFTITVKSIAFAWHNPEAQDIYIKKVVAAITTKGGTATSEIEVGIADDAAGTNRGTEFFDALDADAAAAVHDSWVAGDGGTQTKWVPCQDSASATDGWVVGEIKTEIANGLVGSYYIEYVGK